MKKRYTFYLDQDLMDALRDISWHERSTLNGLVSAMIGAFTKSYRRKHGTCTEHAKALTPGAKPTRKEL